jgi:hypothetical protein
MPGTGLRCRPVMIYRTACEHRMRALATTVTQQLGMLRASEAEEAAVLQKQIEIYLGYTLQDELQVVNALPVVGILHGRAVIWTHQAGGVLNQV